MCSPHSPAGWSRSARHPGSADRGDYYAAARLADLLRERGDAQALTARSERLEMFEPSRLACLLWEQGEVESSQLVSMTATMKPPMS
jgi:hypothetical protein